MTQKKASIHLFKSLLRSRLWVVFVLLLFPLSAFGAGRVGHTKVLDTESFWRVRTIRETEDMVLPDGEIVHGQIKTDVAGPLARWFRERMDVGALPEDKYRVEPLDEDEIFRLPRETSADWMQPDFDDSTWARLRGPILHESTDSDWKLILMRGTFKVEDPNRVGHLTLNLGFRGGAVAYINGVEVGRSNMPEGELDLFASAEPYPEEAYFCEDGYAMRRRGRTEAERERIASRVRSLEDVRIPANKLREGINVLAISVYRAPVLPKFYVSRNRGGATLHHTCHWARIGLDKAELTMLPGAQVTPNTAPMPGHGFLVWNHTTVTRVFPESFPDPFATLQPVQISGVRNGIFSGQFVVSDENPIHGLTAEAGALEGENGAIPADAIKLRYGRPDGRRPRGVQGPEGSFDALEDAPPDPVPLYPYPDGAFQDSGAPQLAEAAIQPVWINVTVPADTAPGTYSGKITVTAEGVDPVEVPLKVKVMDWTLPDFNDFTVHMDLVQSPDTVAMAYDVEPWSHEHLELLDKTFALLKPLAVKTLYVTAVTRTHWGNEHAMVRWVRDDEGELQPNFDVVEKYLDIATKHLGKVPGIIFHTWAPSSSDGHAGGAGRAHRRNNRAILFTMLDPETGELSQRTGPAWGTAEAREFWRKFNVGIREVLARRGLEDSMMHGLIGDVRPTQQGMDDISTGLDNPQWAVHSHYYVDEWKGYPIKMCVALWGVGVRPVDPSEGLSFGWTNPMWVAYFARPMNLASPLVEHRVQVETWLGARRGRTPFVSVGYGTRGLGRFGADFWPVLGRQARGTLAGRYPETSWGQLNLNNGIPSLLGRGENGPVPTVRSEMFRENIQETEARIFIEKALFDDQVEELLGEELMKRCRRELNDRIRVAINSQGEGLSWYISSDWNARAERLFELAGEVADRLGRAPQPNLDRYRED